MVNTGANRITVSGRRTTADNKFISNINFDLLLPYDEQKIKDVAIVQWGQVFDKMKINNIYKPTLDIGKDLIRPDFYLPDQMTFVIVMPCKFDEDSRKYDREYTDLACETEGDVAVCYADGKFKLVDYFDTEERFIRDGTTHHEDIRICDEAMVCRCKKCKKWFFFTNYSWYGCRCCRYYDGNNTGFVLYNHESIFEKINKKWFAEGSS